MADAPVSPQVPSYDYTPLLGLCRRAELILGNPGRKKDRFRTAARALCEFYRVLGADDAFWAEIERVTGDQPDVGILFEAMGDFDAQEYDLLIRAGVDELTAAELAADLTIKLQQYQPGSLPMVQSIRGDVRRMGEAVCDAESDLGNRLLLQSRLKILSRALSVAQAIVAAAINFPAAIVLAFLSVAGAVMMVAQTTADFFAERANDG